MIVGTSLDPVAIHMPRPYRVRRCLYHGLGDIVAHNCCLVGGGRAWHAHCPPHHPSIPIDPGQGLFLGTVRPRREAAFGEVGNKLASETRRPEGELYKPSCAATRMGRHWLHISDMHALRDFDDQTTQTEERKPSLTCPVRRRSHRWPVTGLSLSWVSQPP